MNYKKKNAGTELSSNWFIRYSFPITLPTEPIDPLDPEFDQLFIRTKIYDELDSYLLNIEKQYGKFWISSTYGGCGKSTMISYICRQLYLNINKLRALPFYFDVPEKMGATVQHTFIKNFLKQFSVMDENLRKAKRVLNLTYDQDVEKVVEGFNKFEEGIRDFQVSLIDLNREELEAKFYKVLNSVLLPWREKGVFRKYVLLIDEMDKLSPEDVLNFLSGNQKLFERLYETYGFVAFLAGHASWVERIRSGTEYSYYQGKTFRIPPLVSIHDVSQLVQSRLAQYVYMIPADNPWKEDGYLKLQELTAGVPRKILNLAADVMNEAYHKKIGSIGSGIVEEVLVREDHLHRIADYLQTHYETYVKMKEALDKRVDYILYIFYEMPHQQILKIYDTNMTLRTSILAVELSDDEWLRQVNMLTQIGCLQDKGTVRELSADIKALFDKLSEHPAMIHRLVPPIIRSMGEVKPKVGLPPPSPDFKEIIYMVFRISPTQWFTKQEIYENFSYAASVKSYVMLNYPKKSEEATKKLFEKSFQDFVFKNEDNLLIMTQGEEKLYRKLPAKMKKEDRKILQIGSKELINSYIDLVIESEAYDKSSIDKLDDLIETTLRMICDLKGQRFEKGVLRTRNRYKLFNALGFPRDVKNHIEFYLRESKEVVPSPSIIKEILRHIFYSLIEIYSSVKPPLEQTSKEDYADLNELETSLRQYVEKQMSKISPKWWKERIPRDVQELSEQRKKGNEECSWPWYGKGSESLMCYIDFSDYARILLRRDNWRDCFRKAFKNQTQLQASLERLEPIRNTIAHNRALTPDQKMTLSIEKKFILSCICTET
jgi:hypothetical protein